MVSSLLAASMLRFACRAPLPAAGATRFDLLGGAPRPRRSGIQRMASPGGGGASGSKGVQPRLVVVAAAPSAPGPNNDGKPSDREAVVSSFRMEMELFKLAPRPMQFQDSPKLVEVAAKTAKDSIRLIECLLANHNVDTDTYKDIISWGKTFVTVQGQCADGYVTSHALMDATQSLKLAGPVFFPSADFAKYKVTRSGEEVNQQGYKQALLMAFLGYYMSLALEAKDEYDFEIGGQP